MKETEANDLGVLLRWLGAHPLDGLLVGPPVGEDLAAAAFGRLCTAAARGQHIPVADLDVGAAFGSLRHRTVDQAADVAAQAVCEVLAWHVGQGRSLIHLSSFAAEFRRWQQRNEP